MFRPRSTSLRTSLVLALLAFVTGCGGESPAEKPAVSLPTELAADPATLAAMKDPKFDAFRRAVLELRAASKAANDYLVSVGGKATTEAEVKRFQELTAARDALKARTTEIMGDAAWTDADRKVMRSLFAAPDSQLK